MFGFTCLAIRLKILQRVESDLHSTPAFSKMSLLVVDGSLRRRLNTRDISLLLRALVVPLFLRQFLMGSFMNF